MELSLNELVILHGLVSAELAAIRAVIRSAKDAESSVSSIYVRSAEKHTVLLAKLGTAIANTNPEEDHGKFAS